MDGFQRRASEILTGCKMVLGDGALTRAGGWDTMEQHPSEHLYDTSLPGDNMTCLRALIYRTSLRCAEY